VSSCRPLALALVVAGLLPAAAAAQDWKTVTQVRQRAGEDELRVNVQYGAGKLRVRPARGNTLYRATLEYDADLFDPITRYRDERLTVGVESRGEGIKLGRHEAGELEIELSRHVLLRLGLDFGAVEADLELGGLHIEDIDINTGASETRLRFSEPNAGECRNADIDVGAAAFRVYGLGNLACRSLHVDAGVGDVTLDFTGTWTRDMNADVSVALGTIELIFPTDVGVRVDKDTFLASFDAYRFDKRGDLYYSDNWNRARHRLTLGVSGAFGSVDVRWVQPGATTP